MATSLSVRLVSPPLRATPLRVTSPTLSAVGYGLQTLSSTQTSAPQPGEQNGTRGFESRHAPSLALCFQATMSGVSPLLTLPSTDVVPELGPDSSAVTSILKVPTRPEELSLGAAGSEESLEQPRLLPLANAASTKIRCEIVMDPLLAEDVRRPATNRSRSTKKNSHQRGYLENFERQRDARLLLKPMTDPTTAWRIGALLCLSLSGCSETSAPAASGGAGQQAGGSSSGGQGGSSPLGQAGTTAGAATSGSSATGGAAAGSGAGAGAPSAGTTSMGGTPSSGGTTSSGGVPSTIAAGVRWVGRVDTQSAGGPRFAWSGTGFVGTLTGDTISVKLKSEGDSQPVFFQPVIDGKLGTRVSVSSADGTKTLTLGTGLGAGEHRVELYRETEGKPGFAVSTFLGFESGTPSAPPTFSGRLIEIVGDSISAGYGNLGSEQHPGGAEDPGGGCRFTTETESAYSTYGAVAARALGADASIVAASGWGVYSDNGGNRKNVLGELFGTTIAGENPPSYGFAQKPQALIINLGTNDFSANMMLGSAEFSDAYSALVAQARSKYPDALIYCAVGPMLYGTGLSNARSYLQALVADKNSKGDAKLKLLDFGQQDASKGTGCDWHPSVAENQRMAEQLTQELKQALGW